jgi:hypothetical protein
MGLIESLAGRVGRVPGRVLALPALHNLFVRLGDASRTHSAKMRNGRRLSHCADDIVKE